MDVAAVCFNDFLGCFRGWDFHKPRVEAFYWVPIYNWKQEFFSDLGAGLTVFFTLIPQGLAYSALAGMPPIYGLYAAGFPIFFYFFLGTSKHLVMGPFAITSLLVALVCEQFPYKVGGTMYIKLALTLTLMSGVVSLVAGMLKMGKMVQYLSTAVMSGFLTACACLIILSQIKHVLGIKTVHHTETHSKIIYLLEHLGETQPLALAFSVPSFAALYAANRWKRFNPNTPDKANNALFQLISVFVNSSYFCVFLITTVICSEIQRGPNPMKGFSVVGYVPPGIQPSIFDSTVFSIDEIIVLVPQSIMIAFVGFSCNWAVVKRYSEMFKYPVDPSQELVATGITNVVGSLFFNSFVNAGGMARTAVNAEAGGKSQFSCAIAASLILITLSYFTPLTYNIPMAVLGSIIAAAVLSLVDTERMYKVRSSPRPSITFDILSSIQIHIYVPSPRCLSRPTSSTKRSAPSWLSPSSSPFLSASPQASCSASSCPWAMPCCPLPCPSSPSTESSQTRMVGSAPTETWKCTHWPRKCPGWRFFACTPISTSPTPRCSRRPASAWPTATSTSSAGPSGPCASSWLT